MLNCETEDLKSFFFLHSDIIHSYLAPELANNPTVNNATS